MQSRIKWIMSSSGDLFFPITKGHGQKWGIRDVVAWPFRMILWGRNKRNLVFFLCAWNGPIQSYQSLLYPHFSPLWWQLFPSHLPGKTSNKIKWRSRSVFLSSFSGTLLSRTEPTDILCIMLTKLKWLLAKASHPVPRHMKNVHFTKGQVERG